MRKITSMLIVLALVLSGAALAQSAGNLNNGGFITSQGETLYVSTGEKILKIDASGSAAIADINAYMLQTDGERLYFVERLFDDEKYGYYEETQQTPMSCALDGTDIKKLGESRPVGFEVDYESYSYDTFVGYEDFTVYNGRIYYLANSGAGGEYLCNVVYVDENDKEAPQSQKVTYTSGISLYSMALDGSDVKELVKNIGNGVCRFAIDDDKIYLAGSFADMLYAYYYTNYGVYDLEGKLIKAYPGPLEDDWSFFSDAGKYYHIVDGCQAYQGQLYVGLQDSEGDFRSSVLYKLMDDGSLVQELYQDSMIDSVILDGSVYYVGSASENIYYEENFNYDETLGIYVKKLGEEGLGQKLVPLSDDTVYGVSISVLDGYVYYKTGEGKIYKAPVTGGESTLVA